ncbi:hypothetical protein U472_08265 [Orenia metallireducens]|uniref:Uncharacterized protein n=1 Tax=Orenia metallireducens TaxID=1413210 RepID=A0A1C0A6Y7_9FIRM|nr:hypothetical protein [Orenia metallireducens]OCL26010.1 hypothetical protein U472_08265 [Orenia metallireducens]
MYKIPEESLKITKQIVINKIKNHQSGVEINSEEVDRKVNEVVNKIYSIGGNFNKATIGAVVDILFEEWYNNKKNSI